MLKNKLSALFKLKDNPSLELIGNGPEAFLKWKDTSFVVDEDNLIELMLSVADIERQIKTNHGNKKSLIYLQHSHVDKAWRVRCERNTLNYTMTFAGHTLHMSRPVALDLHRQIKTHLKLHSHLGRHVVYMVKGIPISSSEHNDSIRIRSSHEHAAHETHRAPARRM